MIKANELRVGSLVLVPPVKQLFKDGSENEITPPIAKEVIAIAKNDIVTDGFAGQECAFDPILLTPEWLERFGFEKRNSNKNEWSLSDGSVDYIFDNDSKDFGFEIEMQYKGTGIKYIHQLQNLYFALTGEELILKEKY